jgi:hypothetical protein
VSGTPHKWALSLISTLMLGYIVVTQGFYPKFDIVPYWLISTSYNSYNLFYISMFLHAIFFYIFIFSSVYTLVSGGFGFFRVKMLLRVILSYFKSVI